LPDPTHERAGVRALALVALGAFRATRQALRSRRVGLRGAPARHARSRFDSAAFARQRARLRADFSRRGARPRPPAAARSVRPRSCWSSAFLVCAPPPRAKPALLPCWPRPPLARAPCGGWAVPAVPPERFRQEGALEALDCSALRFRKGAVSRRKSGPRAAE